MESCFFLKKKNLFTYEDVNFKRKMYNKEDPTEKSYIREMIKIGATFSFLEIFSQMILLALQISA